jgi:hypothetical protein
VWLQQKSHDNYTVDKDVAKSLLEKSHDFFDFVSKEINDRIKLESKLLPEYVQISCRMNEGCGPLATSYRDALTSLEEQQYMT